METTPYSFSKSYLWYFYLKFLKIQYIDVIKETIKEGKNKGQKIDIEDDEEGVQKATRFEKIEDFSKAEKIDYKEKMKIWYLKIIYLTIK